MSFAVIYSRPKVESVLNLRSFENVRPSTFDRTFPIVHFWGTHRVISFNMICHFRTYPDITVLFIFIFHLVNELIVTVIECLLFILFMLQSELQFELQFELQLVTVRERLFFSCQSLMDGITSLSTGQRFHRTYAGRLMINEKRIIYKSSDTRIIYNICLFFSFIFKAFGFKTLLLLILVDPCSNPVDYKISIAYRYLFVRIRKLEMLLLGPRIKSYIRVCVT